MQQIKFTSGLLTPNKEEQCVKMAEYYTLILFNGGKVVYKATLPRANAAALMAKSNKIILKSN
jgi:hypothetical protein